MAKVDATAIPEGSFIDSNGVIQKDPAPKTPKELIIEQAKAIMVDIQSAQYSTAASDIERLVEEIKKKL